MEQQDNIYSSVLPWDNLSHAKILITGATGLIGGELVDMFMRNPFRDYEIYASARNITRLTSRFAEYAGVHGFHVMKYDVSEPLVSDVNFQYIIHAASNASPNFFRSNPVEVMKSNIFGVTHLLDYGRTHGLKRMLYVSSGEVYGEGNGEIFKETDSGYVDCASRRACYPSSKRAAETLCISYSEEYGLETVIARLCHTYGSRFTEEDNRAYAQFLRNATQGKNIVLNSKGIQRRSWLYVKDCAQALLYLLLKGQSTQAYNVANGQENMSIDEFAQVIAEVYGVSVQYDIPEHDSSNVGIQQALFSTKKIEALGWKPKYSVLEGIREIMGNSK